jgi:hypothetical protein
MQASPLGMVRLAAEPIPTWLPWALIGYAAISFCIVQGYAMERWARCRDCGFELAFIKAYGCEQVGVSFFWPLALLCG